jgi:hypothetical protein
MIRILKTPLALVLVPAICLTISVIATAQEVHPQPGFVGWMEAQITLPNIVLLVLLVYHLGMARQEILDFRRRVQAVEGSLVGNTLCESRMARIDARFDDLKNTLDTLADNHNRRR